MPTSFSAKLRVIGSHRLLPILLVFLPVVLLRVLFIVTYPLNNTAGDEFNYYRMMLDWKSSLVHAGGYPFLFGMFLRSHLAQAFINLHPVGFSYTLLIAQHAIDLASLLLLFFVLAKVFNRAIAGVSILFCGLDVWNMGLTSSTYPEWLQSALLIFAFCVAYYGLRADSQLKKAILFGGSSVLFTLSFLAKFNSLVMVLLYGFVFFLDKSPLPKKLLNLGIAVTLAFAVIGAYLGLYHYPSTGTYSLTHDKSWVLVQKTSMYPTAQLPPTAGIYTKRWIALSEVLPPSYHVAGPNMYANINAVSAQIRAPYREKYLYILTASESAVDQVIRENQLPATFNLGYSAIPIAYYIGLKESDDLGVNVFKEVLLHNPSRYVRHVFQFLSDFITSPRPTPSFPITPLLNTVATGYGEHGYCLRPAKDMGHGFMRYELIQPICRLTAEYWSTYPVIWVPGMSFFSNSWNIVPLSVIYMVIGLYCLFAAAQWMRNPKNITEQSGLILLLTFLIVLYFVQSSAIFVIRPKEIRFVSPLIDVIFGLCLCQIMGQVIHIYKTYAPWRVMKKLPTLSC